MYWRAVKKYLLLGSCTISLLLGAGTAYALKISLGVVKSRENSDQWVQITNRLKAVGIDYCTLDAGDWQDIADLKDIKVLMLPNVANLSGTQVETLNTWTKKGGKLIITGPTGTLAQTEVRSRLQEIVGAYWGFANAAPSSLEVKEEEKPLWGQAGKIYANISGGVLMPDPQTQTVAVWINQGQLPAVTSTSQAIYLGWRWGQDKVASLTLDKTWLEAALNRYGVNGANSLLPESDTRLCTQTRPRLDENRPIIPNIEKNSLLPEKKN